MNPSTEVRDSEFQSRPLLQMLVDVNEQALEVLVALATDPRDAPHFGPFLGMLRRPLYGLDRQARQRIARIPHLLVDMRFGDAAWWNHIRNQPIRRDGASEASAGRSTARLIDVARSTLLLAWHASQERRQSGALFLLGISTEVAAVLATLRPLEVVHLAQTHFAQVRPRFATHPDLWMQLLNAGRQADAKAFRSVQVRTLQLAGADLAVVR